MRDKGKNAANRLEDLEVREVSVVDKPAIGRRFLIIKRDAEARDMGAPEVTADLSIVDDAEELIEFLALATDDPPAEPAPDPEPEPGLAGLEAIFKATTAGQAVKQLAPLLQRLLGIVNAMKRLGDAPMPAEAGSQLKAIVNALNLLAGGGDKEKAEKVEAGQLGKATSALEKLVALVNKLKEQEAGAEIGKAESSEIGAIAKLLDSIAPEKQQPKAPPQDEADKKKTTKSEEDDDDGDPVIVFKAGAKMRRARLSRFRKAVETLSLLLKELEGEPPPEKDKKKTTKSEEDEGEDELPVPSPELVEKIDALSTTVTTLTEQLAERDEKIVDLSKRVEGIENIRPTGEDDDPPPEPVEKKKSLWSGVV